MKYPFRVYVSNLIFAGTRDARERVRLLAGMTGIVAALATLPGLALAQALRADFNADGFDDLAVPVPHEQIGNVHDAGAVSVIYGTAGGLSATGNQIWHQNIRGIADVAEQGDLFGQAVATGDFNSDGFDDLAVGVPGETVGSLVAGQIHVIYGTAGGLTATGSQLFNKASRGIAGVPEEGARFGNALAAGDFNNDGYDDLAVGAASQRVGSAVSAGVVHIIYGTVGGLATAGSISSQVSANGLSTKGNQFWHEEVPGLMSAAEVEDLFGTSVTAGDFDGDGYDDMAVGLPQRGIGAPSAGAVRIIYGAAGGLATKGNQLLHQNSPGILDLAEAYDSFGVSVVSGNFNGDRYDDLAISVPGKQIGGQPDAGQVAIIYGTDHGLSATGNQIWNQDTPGIKGAAEAGDTFGADAPCPC